MHVLKWHYGRPGKGLVDKDGDIHTWPVFGPDDAPHHTVYQDKNRVNGHFVFQIAPDGGVYNDLGYLNQFRNKSDADVLQHIMDADPQLHPAPTDHWMFGDDSDGFALTASSDEEAAPFIDELKAWLDSCQPQEGEELSPHHTSPMDFVPTSEVVGAKKPPLPLNPMKYITTKAQHRQRVRGKVKRQQKRSMAVDPAWWESYIRDHPYMYHATGEDAIYNILNEGLLPWDYEDDDDQHRSSWDDFLRPRPGHVYMGTQDFVQSIAEHHGWKNRMVKVDLSSLDPSKVNADEDSFVGQYPDYNDTVHRGYPKPYHMSVIDRVVPSDKSADIHAKYDSLANEDWADRRNMMHEWLDEQGIPHEHSYGDWANRFDLTHPEQTKHSIRHFGAVAYNGEIPSHAIEEHEYGTECPECGYRSGDLWEDHTGTVEGSCPNCGWDSSSACEECSRMPSEHGAKPLSCEHCGHSSEGWDVGDPIWYGTHPGMVTKMSPGQAWISTHGEEPFEVPLEHQGLVQPMHGQNQPYEWMDPHNEHYPLNKWPQGYVRTVPLPGQEKLWAEGPWEGGPVQTWKDQTTWDKQHAASASTTHSSGESRPLAQ